MDLKQKVAVITGASSGIGEAIARELSVAGMRLVLNARREGPLKELAAELGNCGVVAGDMVDEALPERLMQSCTENFGGCDVVVNNAGILEIGAVQQIDVDRVCEMVRINVEAAYRMSYIAVRHFLSRKAGHLVNLSSILGTKTRATAGAYAGTKFAIEALSEALRLELVGTGIRVSAIEPGLVMTELHNHMEVHPRDAWGMEEPLVPGDVARCVQFVLEQPSHVLIPRLMVLPTENPI
jgi:NADP-dependent 3-hydroxy acid dehydrogenase YdfG